MNRRMILLACVAVGALIGTYELWQWACMRRSQAHIESELNRRRILLQNLPSAELPRLLKGWPHQSSTKNDLGRLDVIAWRGLLYHHVLWVNSDSNELIQGVLVGQELDQNAFAQTPSGLPVHPAPSQEQVQKAIASAFQFFQNELTIDQGHARLRDVATEFPKATVSAERGKLAWNELTLSAASQGLGVMQFTSPFADEREFDLVICASEPVQWDVITSSQSNDRVLPLPAIREENATIPGVSPKNQRAVYFQSIPGGALRASESYLVYFAREGALATPEVPHSAFPANANANPPTPDITVKFLLFLSPKPNGPAQNSWRRTADEICQHLGLEAKLFRYPATSEGLAQALQRCNQSVDLGPLQGSAPLPTMLYWHGELINQKKLPEIPKTLRQVASVMKELRPSTRDKPEWISLEVNVDAPFDAIRVRAPAAGHPIMRLMVIKSAGRSSTFSVEDVLPGAGSSSPWQTLTTEEAKGIPLPGRVQIFQYSADVIAGKDVFLWHKCLGSDECALMAAVLFDDAPSRDLTEELALFGIELPSPPPLAGSHALTRFGAETKHLLFTPDSKCLISIDEKARVRSWDVASHRVLPELENKSQGLNLPAISPDSRTLVCNDFSDDQIKWWDLASGRRLGMVEYRSIRKEVLGCAFGPSSKKLAILAGWRFGTPSEPFSFRMIDLDRKTISAELGLTSHNHEILRHLPILQYTPASNAYVAIMPRKVPRPAKVPPRDHGVPIYLQLWRDNFGRDPDEVLVDDFVETAKTDSGQPMLSVAADGRRVLAIGPSGQARIWDTTTLTEISSHKFPLAARSAALSPDGSKIAARFMDSATLLLIDSTSWDARPFPEAGEGLILQTAYSPDGRWIATGTDRGVVRLWDTTMLPGE